MAVRRTETAVEGPGRRCGRDSETHSGRSITARGRPALRSSGPCIRRPSKRAPILVSGSGGAIPESHGGICAALSKAILSAASTLVPTIMAGGSLVIDRPAMGRLASGAIRAKR